jgi:hypothetical protein
VAADKTIKKTLSKSRFKLALQCPTKVYYSLHNDRYVNSKDDDEFLEALADGGHQVGALAKAMYRAEDPAAEEVDVKGDDAQVEKTAALLRRENVTIFEGTIRHGNLLARVDVLRKRGNVVELIEVKAKSWDRSEDSLTGQTPKANPLSPDWEEYVYDIAFQERVLRRSYPSFDVQPFLLLVDKQAINSLSGLGTKFVIIGSGRSRSVQVDENFSIADLAQPLLVAVPAGEAIRIAQTQVRSKKGRPDIVFDSLIDTTAAAIVRGERLGPHVGPSACKGCEFYCEPSVRSEDTRSGWAECMETLLKRPVTDPRSVSVFALYDKADVQRFIDQKRVWLQDLAEEELTLKEATDKISGTARHRLQWREIVARDGEPFLRRSDLRKAMRAWRWPLHFIDFETAAPALPFHAGQRPYQPILFQFSHHIVAEDGSVRHADQCLISEGEESPSITVLRALQRAIGQDDGTVLHWFSHERTILRSVRDEVRAKRPPDEASRLSFLEKLGIEKDSGLRMFDLGKLVKQQVFLAGTSGSSSMKKFLQPVMAQSPFLKERYGRPVYGTAEMPSQSFNNEPKAWWQLENGVVRDPYTMLGQLLSDAELDATVRAAEEAEESDFIANGGAAMLAYGDLQQPDLPAAERQRIESQLKRYCELDTLAMVMVYEALREWVAE